MTQGWNAIERQVINALNRKCLDRGHFSSETKEQLWVWQGRRRVDIKEALSLVLPAVYSPPRVRLLDGTPDDPRSGQLWHVVTEADAAADVYLKSGATGRPGAYIVQVSPTADVAEQKAFCEEISRLGLVGASVALRGADLADGAVRLAEIYLGLGRCYAGAVVADLLRVIDHLEQQFGLDAEPVVFVLSGLSVPMGLAAAAIDQRVSGLLVDFSEVPRSILTPVGNPPLFRDQYLHLGVNPLLVVAQCCAPRPMMVIGSPHDTSSSWLESPKAGILSFSDHLAGLQAAYEAAKYPGRLTIVEPGQPQPPVAEQIVRILEYYQTPAG